MHHAAGTGQDPCILDDVQPLLAELHTPLAMRVVDEGHARRPQAERFVQRVFRHAYGADIRHFYPTLIHFEDERRQRAVVGYRNGTVRPLFAEQYLDAPAEHCIGRHLDQDIERASLVEVGNLALTDAGDTRWVIAAVTLFLHRLGYRWVLFTAVRPLFNAFRRLGLNPIRIAEADAAHLSDDGHLWGRYYDTCPVVCAGSIESGYHKLLRHGAQRQPLLQELLEQAQRLAETITAPARTSTGGM
jgi:hypothetical protein